LIAMTVAAIYLVPQPLLFIPLADLINRLDLGNTLSAVILTYPTMLVPFCAWLLIGYFKTVPKELEEAARIDGASRLQTMRRIFLPLCTPGFISAGIFAFTLSQNEFLYALIFLTQSSVRTVPVGVIAALSLRQAGFRVDVYEQAPALTHIGGGINMGPNAARVLLRLGLGEGLPREGVRPRSTHQRRWNDGRTLQRAPLNPQCEELYGAPHVTIHRADLLAVISSGLPPEHIHLGHRLIGVADRGDHVEARFDNGARITPDILV